jgi:hydrogenase maturation factor HypE
MTIQDLINGAKLPEYPPKKCTKCGREIDLLDKEGGHTIVCAACYYGELGNLVEEGMNERAKQKR